MRRVATAGMTLAVLVALYAAAGFWIAPGYVRDALVEAARARGLTLELARVETKPFALRVELEGVALRAPGGDVLAKAEAASADLAWASLWRRGWVVEEARLSSPDVALGALPGVKDAGADGAASMALTLRRVVIENGRLRYAARNLALEELNATAHGLSTLGAAAGTYDAAARLAGGQAQISSRGAIALAPFAAEGTLSIAALRADRVLPEAAGQLQGSARYAYRDGKAALHDVALAGSDIAYAGVELPRATLRAQTVPLAPAGVFEAAGQAELAPHGKIAAQGRVQISPLELHLNLAAESVPLAHAQRWLPPELRFRIASGALSGTGLLHVSPRNTSYQGSVAVRELRLEERDSGALLLAWQRAATERLRLELAPLRIEAGEIAAHAPEGRLVIGPDGVVNIAALFPAGERSGSEKDEPAQASFERLRIEKGTLHFADRSLATPFEATIVGLSGTVSGFSTVRNEAARVRLDGRVQPYGDARIRGSINLKAPTALADVTATLRNLRLEAFNPYVAKFAGYRIASGRLSAKLRYEVRDGRLVGTNDLRFENMQLGEKLEEKGLVDLPLELAVALLADSKGRIDIDIPVRGNLNDPQFDIGALVARAVGNAVKKIVTAPFRALAALFGREKDDPGAVAFQAGSAELSPPAEEHLAGIARALEERPRLGVVVHGGYDPARDAEALRMRAARAELARAAGVAPPLNLSNPKVVRAAERLYLKRGGDRAALAALKKSEASYGRVLLQRIAAATPVADDAAQALGVTRAEAVRAAILEQGIDSSRVAVGESLRTQAAEEGVRTELALAPGQPGAASAARGSSAEEEEDPVRAAQRRLNAAGFEAGPVDGILGSRTRRALIKYQAANGLETSGELDAATRAQLIELR